MIEARRFYSLFDPASAGTPSAAAALRSAHAHRPALNTDTTNRVSPNARLQWITGPGGHGALSPSWATSSASSCAICSPAADADHPLIPAGSEPARMLWR